MEHYCYKTGTYVDVPTHVCFRQHDIVPCCENCCLSTIRRKAWVQSRIDTYKQSMKYKQKCLWDFVDRPSNLGCVCLKLFDCFDKAVGPKNEQ